MHHTGTLLLFLGLVKSWHLPANTTYSTPRAEQGVCMGMPGNLPRGVTKSLAGPSFYEFQRHYSTRLPFATNSLSRLAVIATFCNVTSAAKSVPTPSAFTEIVVLVPPENLTKLLI